MKTLKKILKKNIIIKKRFKINNFFQETYKKIIEN